MIACSFLDTEISRHWRARRERSLWAASPYFESVGSLGTIGSFDYGESIGHQVYCYVVATFLRKDLLLGFDL